MTRSQQPVWIGRDGRRWNHFRVDIAVMDDFRLDAYHVTVYEALVLHAEVGTGHTKPSVPTIAKVGRCSERTAQYRLRDLEAWGYIATAVHAGKASEYVLLPPPSTGAGDAGVHGGVHLTTRWGASDDAPYKEEPDLELEEQASMENPTPDRPLVERGGLLYVLDPRADRMLDEESA